MFADNMAKVAKKLIDKFGDDASLVNYSRGAYNPDTGESDKIRTEHPTKIHISQFDNSLVVAGVVNMDDMKILCYNFDNVLPDKDWKVLMQGVEINIIAVQNIITAQNKLITFELQCRK